MPLPFLVITPYLSDLFVVSLFSSLHKPENFIFTYLIYIIFYGSFIVSFSNRAPDPEKDSASVQEFLLNMEGAFKVHMLWAGSSEEELESAGEVRITRFVYIL